jgi:hypothetical protein
VCAVLVLNVLCVPLFPPPPSDYVYDPINMLGLVVGFMGGVLYAQWSYQESQAPKVAPLIPDGSKAVMVGGEKRDSTV